MFRFPQLSLLLLSVATLAAEPELQRFEHARPKMGTLFRVVVYGTDETAAYSAAMAAFQRIEQLNSLFSDYKADSELNLLCAHAGQGPVPVSPELYEILAISRHAAKESKGAFDVTLGPLIRLWRASRKRGELPSREEIDAARKRCGYEKMKLEPCGRTVELKVPGMQLDLGGIAKGYAADAALAVLRERGFPRALIAAGGDIRVGDAPPGERGWKIVVAGHAGDFEAPKAAPAAQEKKDGEQQVYAANPGETLWLVNAAVSTSGDAEQFVEIGGVRYSHIVDPKTGIGMTGRHQCTIVAPTATESDWRDTAEVLKQSRKR